MKTARARATYALGVYQSRKPNGFSDTDFGRALDRAFENGDGWAVGMWMVAKMWKNRSHLNAVLSHHPGSSDWWMKKAALAIKGDDIPGLKVIWEYLLNKSLESDWVAEESEPRKSVDRPEWAMIGGAK